jgi:hypothetical protein
MCVQKVPLHRISYQNIRDILDDNRILNNTPHENQLNLKTVDSSRNKLQTLFVKVCAIGDIVSAKWIFGIVYAVFVYDYESGVIRSDHLMDNEKSRAIDEL